jgi:hypothetical protein
MPKIDRALIDSTFVLYHDKVLALTGGSAAGTGFVVGHAVDRSPGDGTRVVYTHFYGVTSAHVARNAPVIRLGSNAGREPFDFDPADWELHAEGDDVAIVPLDIVALNSDAPLAAVSSSYFIDGGYDHADVGVGDDVFMIGLFADLEGKATNNPMARFGNISMMANEETQLLRSNDKMLLAHVVDMHSRPGFSGSPVFVYRTFGADLNSWSDGESVLAKVKLPNPTPQRIRDAVESARFRRQETYLTETVEMKIRTMPVLRLLGIHSAQFVEKWSLRPVPGALQPAVQLDPEKYFVEGASGMTLVTPSLKIKNLLDSPGLEERRLRAEKALAKT